MLRSSIATEVARQDPKASRYREQILPYLADGNRSGKRQTVVQGGREVNLRSTFSNTRNEMKRQSQGTELFEGP